MGNMLLLQPVIMSVSRQARFLSRELIRFEVYPSRERNGVSRLKVTL